MTPPRTRFAIALRTVAAAALVTLAGALPVRAIAAWLDPFEPYPGHTAPYGVARSRAIRAVLPEIADRADKTAVVLGSSGLARAFVPSVFDAELAEGGKRYVSFNLAQMLFQPETALAMAKVIRRTYEERNKRLGMAILGISVPELNRDAVRAAQRNMPDQPFAFSSADVLADRVRADPLGGLRDGLELLFFGNLRPERVRLWLEDWIAARPVGCETGLTQPPGAEARASLADFCAELRRQFPQGVPPWNRDTRGGLDFGLPATRPMLEHLVELQPNVVPLRSPGGDARQTFAPKSPANIDEASIRQLIGAVRELKQVSDATFVLRDILNPALVAPVPPEQLAQWRAVAERIAGEGGAPLIDLNDGTVTASDFGDRTHLTPLAAEAFSSVLAARVRPMLQEHRASR